MCVTMSYLKDRETEYHFHTPSYNDMASLFEGWTSSPEEFVEHWNLLEHQDATDTSVRPWEIYFHHAVERDNVPLATFIATHTEDVNLFDAIELSDVRNVVDAMESTTFLTSTEASIKFGTDSTQYAIDLLSRVTTKDMQICHYNPLGACDTSLIKEVVGSLLKTSRDVVTDLSWQHTSDHDTATFEADELCRLIVECPNLTNIHFYGVKLSTESFTKVLRTIRDIIHDTGRHFSRIKINGVWSSEVMSLFRDIVSTCDSLPKTPDTSDRRLDRAQQGIQEANDAQEMESGICIDQVTGLASYIFLHTLPTETGFRDLERAFIPWELAMKI